MTEVAQRDAWSFVLFTSRGYTLSGRERSVSNNSSALVSLLKNLKGFQGVEWKGQQDNQPTAIMFNHSRVTDDIVNHMDEFSLCVDQATPAVKSTISLISEDQSSRNGLLYDSDLKNQIVTDMGRVIRDQEWPRVFVKTTSSAVLDPEMV
ncbi:hypothetical protein BDN72DRAFT_857923 [Pluteus cervinus]|uniref:Uncharacterized protein n=1 Tax=Pluteus cervinus TaxID=181527 RepID=A0ACD3ASZ2_9AGAR|nr:hypothetical protein BDN72DRAFT_857923 [Pluteus cervinus]